MAQKGDFMIFKNSKWYDALKWLSLVALDAIGIAYEKLASIWGLPYGEQVKDTCIVLSVLIGALIGVSGIKYARLNGSDRQKYGDDEIAEDAEDIINGI